MDFDQPCYNECAISITNSVVISTIHDNVECSKKNNDYFSKISSETRVFRDPKTKLSKDFKYLCNKGYNKGGAGETCGSGSISAIEFKQCYQ